MPADSSSPVAVLWLYLEQNYLQGFAEKCFTFIPVFP